ncbi:hypothetical protein F383_22278 [Gossypium arboreum]|uniref:Uncharacterized protein n=1 Tax=Gossypium arboreum TaxID=29729 RepID=A0A0B0NXD7_GOSAR|nr:hypothetical protein F383_22278 [Gossypium arboreum]
MSLPSPSLVKFEKGQF